MESAGSVPHVIGSAGERTLAEQGQKWASEDKCQPNEPALKLELARSIEFSIAQLNVRFGSDSMTDGDASFWLVCAR